MSGLLLDFGRRGPLADRRPFAAALADLAVRGPDGREEYAPPEGHLGVVELASTRRAAGGGALAVDPTGAVGLALDGRIDAFPEEFAGGEPASGSDAERLLAAYLVHGERFLDEVEGSFVVALLDRRGPRAIAARDGMGNRYAGFALDAGRFAVASDDAALLALPGVDAGFDPRRLAAYYGSAELAGPETFFRGVTALLPGELLIVEPAQVRRRLLPRPDPAARLELPRWEDYVEAFAERLDAAVHRRLRGADRVAVWLSGGLDSSPIAALAARALSDGRDTERVVGLCWRVDDPEGDERAWAAETARFAGFPLVEVDCSDAGPFAPLASWPVRRSTPEQTAYRRFHDRAYARARELGADAVLWGFGGDMLYAAPRRWLWDLLAAEGPGAAIDGLRAGAGERGLWRTLRSDLVAPLVPHALRRRPAGAPTPAWLTPGARALLAGRPAWPPARHDARRPRQAERLLALLDAFGVGVEAADAARFGLELRSPLRDRRLVEFALAVPDHVLFRGAETRPVMRAATRGLLPETVRRRRGKASFAATVARALRPERRPWAAELLGRPDALWRPFVEPAAVQRWLAHCPTGGEDDLGLCLAIYGELWHRRWR